MRERELLKSARNYVEAVATSGKVGSVFAKNLLVEIDEYLQKPLPESKPQEFDLLQEDPVERQQFDEIVSRLNINPLVAVKDALATMHKCAEYPQGSYAKMLAIYSNEIAKAVFVSKDPSSARIAIYTEPPARKTLTDDELLVVGVNLLKAISAHAYPDWHPADCPSEIVGDLRGLCDELKTECESLRKDAERYRFLRDEDNWGDDSVSTEETDGSRWGILGELHAGEFDTFVDKAIEYESAHGIKEKQ